MSTPKTRAQLAAEEIKKRFGGLGVLEEIAAIISKHFPKPLPVSGGTPEFDAMCASVQGGYFKDGSGDGVTPEEDYYEKSRDLCKSLERRLATERAARELIEDASRKMSFENATLHLRVVAAEARISELESENQNHAEHVLLERGLRQASEAARELAEKERDSSRNFADSLMSNLDQIRIATEWLDDGFGPNTATALALKAARELKRIKELRGTHDCDCEICSRTSKVCPATTSSYALALMEAEARASVAEAKSGDVAKALEPFARMADKFDVEPYRTKYPDATLLRDNEVVSAHNYLTLGDCRKAKAALASVPAETERKTK